MREMDEALLRGVGRRMREAWRDAQRRVVLPGERQLPNKYGEQDCLVLLPGGLDVELRIVVSLEESPVLTSVVRIRPDLTAQIHVEERNLTIEVGRLRDWTPDQVETLFAECLDVAAVLCC